MSNELVAVIEPAPDFVIPRMPHQSHVEAEPTDSVPTVVLPGELFVRPDWALDVPVILTAPLTVVVAFVGMTRVFPVPMVMEAKVLVWLIRTVPLLLLLATVKAP